MRKLDVIDTKYLLLEMADQKLDTAKQEAKRTEVLALIAANPQQKVREKCDRLFDWMQNGGKLNNVIVRTIRVLMGDGYLVFGVNGNLHQDFLKEYSVETVNAQASQMSSMLPMLKIARKDINGRFGPNPDSLLLMKLSAELGLTFRVSVC